MRRHLFEIQRPSQHLGSEWNAVRKDPARVRARVALAFPDLYEVGMSYTGQRILYSVVNRDPRFWAERVFAPPVETAGVLRRLGEPLATLESGTPLHALDAVAFSLTHELCYTNVLYMLDLGGIPLRGADRTDAHPLVMAGGGCTFNAEPLAPFIDLMVLGDGEDILPVILERIAEARGSSRRELLAGLARLPGIYVPSFYKDLGEDLGPGRGVRAVPPAPATVEKAMVPDLDAAHFPSDLVVPWGQAVHDRLTVEIARGCTRGCRFCQAGMIYRPVRERSIAAIDRIASEGLARTGFEELSLLSLSTGDFSALAGLFETTYARCRAEQVAISLPSLRVGSLNDRIMALMADLRRTGATLAPEAGSQRLRDVINKGITEEGLIEHTRTLFERGWQSVKLYFMIGLPTETRDDLKAIVDLCLKVQAAAGRNVKRLQITASVSPFVPKPHTPFQWERQLGAGGIEEITERIDFIRELVRPHKRIRLRWHEPGMSWLEGVFSRGDRRLAGVVERAYSKGALFSSWVDHLRLDLWREALAEEGLDPAGYLGARDPLVPLPWDHLSPGVTREFLLRERERAFKGSPTPDCRYGACLACGVCNIGSRPSTLAVQAATMDIRPRVNLSGRDQEDAPAAEPPRPAEDLSEKRAMVRIFFKKLGPAVFLSQLELQHGFERAFRRARLPLSFSGGFHPMPMLSFGRALPVGVASLEEWVNLTLRRETDPASILAALKNCLPPGLVPTRVEPLELKRRQAQAVREEFLVLYRGSPEEKDLWRSRWPAFMARETAIWTRRTDKGEKSLDLRPLVLGAEPFGPSGMRLLLDWSAGYASPAAIVRFVHEAAGESLGPDCFRLVKLRQIFAAEPEECPADA